MARSRTTTEWSAQVRAEAHAVYAWWTDRARLEEMKATWARQRNFVWHESQGDGRVDVAASWTTGKGTEIALRLTFDRTEFPHARNHIIQQRRHLTGREDLSESTSTFEFRALEPSLTEVRLRTEREREGWSWSQLHPPARWLADRHARRHFETIATRCEGAL